jgi:23S rRNA pseudouridine1911/1915/1917 synthase
MTDDGPQQRHLYFSVPPGKSKERIDKYLTHHIQNATRSKIHQAIEADYITVNGKPVKPSYLVVPGDEIHVVVPKPPPQEALPENIPLTVIYEDDDLLVIDKPAGMVVHPAFRNYSGTLVNALLHYSNNLSTANAIERPGIVHRIDKDTSGLLVVAKNDTVHAGLAKQFAKKTVEREYWAVVWGTFKNKRGVIDTNLGRSKSDRKKVAVVAEGKHAITEYEVLEEFDIVTLVRLRLKTGRTHQIRVHLAHIHHPVFGDPTYGGRNPHWAGPERTRGSHMQNLLDLIPRQALHAKTLGFIHPVNGKMLRFDSEVPDDMQQLLSKLRQKNV